jgi:hypothetical protein
MMRDVLGMRLLSDQRLSVDETQKLFGARVQGHTSRWIDLRTVGTNIGVELVEFSPGSTTIIREGGVGISCEALKMLDFFTPDPAAALARFRTHGFEVVSDGAPVDIPDGRRYSEAHVKGPDGLMLAAIYPLNSPLSDYVSITDRTFSEIQSSSGPVSDFEPVRQFYVQTLGIPVGLKYEFKSPAFSRMIGAGRVTRIRANNYGRKVEDVMLGIIHYGLPTGSYASLRERAQPPNRGLVGVRLAVQGLDELTRHCERDGYEIAVPAADLPPSLGRGRAAVVRGPHGVWHFLREC